ncbi:hypothetical protein N7519_000368 [Penicillium mononematosum]|uniref:uncharacterized protein n=1 Tax=Penicillium mononematosum TaxID=268346 RepID=UPI0025471154|nr:uncharacterized protein N7519_000368 [Penicillium mononematosum]KAJ6190347.1 hypothetical protein N7519_000368 [Penicillium mononematosum]
MTREQTKQIMACDKTSRSCLVSTRKPRLLLLKLPRLGTQPTLLSHTPTTLSLSSGKQEYQSQVLTSGPLLGVSKERAMLTKQRGISERRERIFAQLQ